MRDWLGHRAAATPNELAVIDADSDTRWSYSGLDAAVDETAGRLAALGVQPGEQVGMLTSTGFLSMCLLHAAQRLGLHLVPLNSRLTAAELAAQIEQVDLSMLVCDADTEPEAVEAADGVPVASIDEPQWDSVQSFKTVEPESVTPAEWARDDTQLIVFTSGSTGRPKPVVLTMGNLLASAIASAFRLGVDPDDRWLLTLSLYHVGGIAPIFRSTLYGTAVVLRSEFEPGRAADDIDRYDVTVVSVVPTMLKRMLDRRGTLSDSLRVVLLGGAPAPGSLLRRCENYSIPVHPTYGMTETASQVATARPQAAFENPSAVGAPLLWTDLTIVDDGGSVEQGETGEIVVAGPTVTPGYYGDRVGDDEDPFCEYGLRTGDAGYRTDDGALVVCNRIDDRIHSGGETIDPGEIVDVLREQHGIDDAAVVGLPDEEWGERVAALVVPVDSDLTRSAVETACRDRLADFKVPKTIEFDEDLPRTASGSLDREAVRERLQELADDRAAAENALDGRAAITRIEDPQLPAGDGTDDETADHSDADIDDEPDDSADADESSDDVDDDTDDSQ
ncbi:o-succinylbenzoate--CoA ligase [Halonotius terrestris]|uniref:O-succinylbenzoate--CoA ligase n=1 Tax=Halonotius terrestris TaxID=2487750 RepID=A0A8J8PAQ7_9EURY|nr:o-succinylbenzoate--CoA ligase [Halonotius terrestris]TQQ79861.1 o-succinylbenzoate--CoA ligase [Halonotius terrestris]